eukprot:scaffold10793_cov96-Phaeocystis_antarctica.AAC.1
MCLQQPSLDKQELLLGSGPRPFVTRSPSRLSLRYLPYQTVQAGRWRYLRGDFRFGGDSQKYTILLYTTTQPSSFHESPVDAASPMSDWLDYDRAGIPVGATQINHNTFVAEVTAVQVLRALLTEGHSAKVHHSLLSVLHALRADSADAPETHGEAVKLGPPWPAAISKEFANHEQNASWRTASKVREGDAKLGDGGNVVDASDAAALTSGVGEEPAC